MTKLDVTAIEKFITETMAVKTREEYLDIRMKFGMEYMSGDDIHDNQVIFDKWGKVHSELLEKQNAYVYDVLGVTQEDIHESNRRINPQANTKSEALTALLEALLAALANAADDEDE